MCAGQRNQNHRANQSQVIELADPNIIAAALKAKEQPLSSYLFEASPQAPVPTVPGQVPLSQAQLDMQPEEGYKYGYMPWSPYRRKLDPDTGQLGDFELTWPTIAREFGTGLIDLVRGPQTGNVTPEGLQTLMDMGLTSALFRPRPDTASMVPAWHGTAHTFDKFDLTKIGTGEGGQAYGHGLYFAGRKGTGKFYRDKLAAGDRLFWKDGKQVAVSDNKLSIMASFARGYGDLDDAAKGIQDQINSIDNGSSILFTMTNPPTPKRIADIRQDHVDALEWFKKNRDDLEIKGDRGNLYRVKLDVEEEDLLDWDKSFDEQPQAVKDALLRIWLKHGGSPETKRPFTAHKGANGGSIYAALATTQWNSQRGGSDFELKKAASRALNEEGIPGIRYDDAMSRGNKYRVKLSTSKGPYADNSFSTREQAAVYAREKEAEGFTTEIVDEGTSNYVIFDDKLIEKVPESELD